jgi:ATP-dependent helicase/nuclease subunit A
LQPLILTHNFRSDAKIVEWNNQVFKCLFPEQEDIEKGAVKFNASTVVHTSYATDEENLNTAINIKGFISHKLLPSPQTQYVIDTINFLQQHYPQESIAILVRSRTHLRYIMQAVKKAKLSFNAVDIDPLGSKQIILDLLSLTCALLNPADRIAWLSILRAPWCGLKLADLHRIAQAPHQTILEQLNCPTLQISLSDDAKQRVARILPILKLNFHQRFRKHLRLWIEETWLALGGPACLENEAAITDVKAYFALLDQFSAHPATLNVDDLKKDVQTLFAPANHHKTLLNIMTIHSAKGLEFDTVILPHLERKTPHDAKQLLLWMDRIEEDRTSLILAPINPMGTPEDTIYQYINYQEQLKAAHEINRLLYVATTRAKKRLYLSFETILKENSAIPADPNHFQIEAGSFLQKLWPIFSSNLSSYLYNMKEINSTAPAVPIKPTKYLYRLASDWQNPIIFDFPQASLHRQAAGFKLAHDTAKLTGTVIHLVLQHLANLGSQWWISQNIETQIAYLQKLFKKMGLSTSDNQVAIHLSLQAIENCLNDPRGQWILHTHQDARSELAISMQANERLIIDRTFIENNIRWIIDYKTVTFTQTDLTLFLNTEKEKYLTKMQQYANAFHHLAPSPIRVGLYFPAIPAWIEWSPAVTGT